jgi:hypothetical protein
MVSAQQRHAASDAQGLPLGWLVLGLVSLAALVWLGTVWWSGQQCRQTDRAPRLKLDINRASARQLRLLPGVGSGRAGRIVAARQTRGGFRDLRELDAADLLGPGASERLAPYLLPVGETARQPGARPVSGERQRQ